MIDRPELLLVRDAFGVPEVLPEVGSHQMHFIQRIWYKIVRDAFGVPEVLPEVLPEVGSCQKV